MEDGEVRRQFATVHEKLGVVEQLARRQLQETERMSKVQQDILNAVEAAAGQLRADKVLIVGQADTIARQAAEISALKAAGADMTARLNAAQVNLDDEVDPDSIHSHLADLTATVADVAGIVAAATSGTAPAGTPPAVGQNPGVQVAAGALAPGAVALPPAGDEPPTRGVSNAPADAVLLSSAATLKNADGSEVQGIPAAAPGDLTPGAIAPSADGTPLPPIVPLAGAAPIAGVNVAPIVASVVEATGHPEAQVAPAVAAFVDATDARASLDVAAGAAADAAVSHGAEVDVAGAIAAAIGVAVAPTAGNAPAADSSAPALVPAAVDASKPNDLPPTSVAQGSAPAEQTIGAPPAPDLAAAVAAPAAPAVAVTGTASDAAVSAGAMVPGAPGAPAPAQGQ